jgi:hypothetical protein
MIAKILNNLQVTVKNIHVRYEDSMSVPGVSGPITTFPSFADIVWTAPILGRIDAR